MPEMRGVRTARRGQREYIVSWINLGNRARDCCMYIAPCLCSSGRLQDPRVPTIAGHWKIARGQP